MLIRAVVAVFVAMLHAAALADDDFDCSYKYISQPPPNPRCDPYEEGIIRISCIVEVPCSDTNISIGWFVDNCDQLTNTADVTIITQTQSSATSCQIESTLTIENLGDSYAGKYTCDILGGEKFIPSHPLDLPTFSDLLNLLAVTPCANGFVHTSEEMKCAELFINGTIPSSLSCTATEAVQTSASSTEISATVPPGAAISTSIYISITHTSSVPPSSMAAVFPTPSSTGPTGTGPEEPVFPTPSSTGSTSTEPEEPTTSARDSTATWLYVVVAVAAVFFVIIVALIIMITGMYKLKKHSQGDIPGTNAGSSVEMSVNFSSGVPKAQNEYIETHDPGPIAVSSVPLTINSAYGVISTESVNGGDGNVILTSNMHETPV